MNDLIQRQDVIDVVGYEIDDGYNAIVDRINSLPSAGQNCVLCEYYTEIETDDGIKGECTRRTGSDLISKQDVKWQIQEWINELNEAIDMLDSIPSADRPTGEWVKVIDEETSNVTKWHYECDQCRTGRYENGQRYCHNCGAKMIREDGEEE